MSFTTQMATDNSSVFSTDEFAQTVTYAGSDISAVVEYENEGDESGGSVKTQARLFVKVSDVANPTYRDAVVIGGVTWNVQQVLAGNASHWELLIETDERPRLPR